MAEIPRWALERIQEVQEKQLTELDLSSSWDTPSSARLGCVPEQVFELERLFELGLAWNALQALPPEIGQLTNLTSLGLSANELTALPPEIGQLTNLTELDLARNKLTALPPEVGQLTNLTSLNLAFNQLEALPLEMCQLTNLTELYLVGNRLEAVPREIVQLISLTWLSLAANELTALPREIGQLSNLTELDLSGNRLKMLPPEIVQLANLASLDLSGNWLEAVPPEIVHFANLASLDLSVNGLEALPPEIVQLANLTSLDLSGNELTALPPEIVQLANLTELRLVDNGLEAVPPEIVQLTNLTYLDLSHNGLEALPPEIGQLTNLTSLGLSANELTALPPEIGQLTNLTELYLTHNGLRAFPPEIGQLINLTELYVAFNQLEALPPEIGQLSNLTLLELSGNGLEVLPPEIVRLTNLDNVNFLDNPLEEPPLEVAAQGIAAIRDYFRQLDEGVGRLLEAKLLIVGEPGAGKTTLARKIVDPDYVLRQDEASTEGIDVIRWGFPLADGRTFDVNIWDFGGQEIYKATHRFFLTKRSLYALVADDRKADTDFFYWLNAVEVLSDNSPVLIIKNEKQDRRRDINERQLRGRFRNFKDTLSTNLATNRGLDKVVEAVKYHMRDLPHVGSALPKTWVDVRAALEADERCYIALDDYLEICEKAGIRRHSDKLQLSGYLHDLGVCLYFQDDSRLSRLLVLKPEWATDAVYRVLDNDTVVANQGEFTDANLEEIWSEDGYSRMRPELLSLMMKFQLCYEIPGQRGCYIAPQLLTVEQPDYPWMDRDNRFLRYCYEFLPRGIVTQFIVAMHNWIISQRLVWRSGILLRWEQTIGEVLEDRDKREIRVRVAGLRKRDLLTIVMHELDKIHSSFRQLKYRKLIPCNCASCRGNPEPAFYDFDTLMDFVSHRKCEIECRRHPYEMVNVLGLLDDVMDRRLLFDGDLDRSLAVRDPLVIEHVERLVVQKTERGNVIMEQNVRKERVIELGANATVTAPITIADSIENSFNTLAESKVQDDVEALLEKLLKAVAEVNSSVGDAETEAAEEMARDAETLVKEAASSKPRQRWYEVSIEGLEQAAINIGRVAKPVLEIVGELRKALLGR